MVSNEFDKLPTVQGQRAKIDLVSAISAMKKEINSLRSSSSEEELQHLQALKKRIEGLGNFVPKQYKDDLVNVISGLSSAASNNISDPAEKEKQAEEEKRKQAEAEAEEEKRKQAEAEAEEEKRKQAEAEEEKRKQAEAEEEKRKQAEAEEEEKRKQAEAEEEKRKQAEEEQKKQDARINILGSKEDSADSLQKSSEDLVAKATALICEHADFASKQDPALQAKLQAYKQDPQSFYNDKSLTGTLNLVPPSVLGQQKPPKEKYYFPTEQSPDYIIEYSPSSGVIDIRLGDQHKGKTADQKQALLREAVGYAVVLVKAHNVSGTVSLNDASVTSMQTNHKIELKEEIARKAGEYELNSVTQLAAAPKSATASLSDGELTESDKTENTNEKTDKDTGEDTDEETSKFEPDSGIELEESDSDEDDELAESDLDEDDEEVPYTQEGVIGSLVKAAAKLTGGSGNEKEAPQRPDHSVLKEISLKEREAQRNILTGLEKDLMHDLENLRNAKSGKKAQLMILQN